jgi:hypothetical protein
MDAYSVEIMCCKLVMSIYEVSHDEIRWREDLDDMHWGEGIQEIFLSILKIQS